MDVNLTSPHPEPTLSGGGQVKDLLEALTLFAKYTSDDHPTCCEHDMLYVLVDPAAVSAEDCVRLDVLGFTAQESDGNFRSSRFGSA